MPVIGLLAFRQLALQGRLRVAQVGVLHGVGVHRRDDGRSRRTDERQVPAVGQRAERREAGCLACGEVVFLPFLVVSVDESVDGRPVVAHVVAAYGDDVRRTGHVADRSVACSADESHLLVVVEVDVLCVAVDIDALPGFLALDFQRQLVVAVLVGSLVVAGHDFRHGIVASCLGIFHRCHADVAVKGLGEGLVDDGPRHGVVAAGGVGRRLSVRVRQHGDAYGGTVAAPRIGHDDLEFEFGAVVAVGGDLSVAEVVVGLLARRKLPCLHRREEGLDGLAGIGEGLLQRHGTVGLVAGGHADDGVLAFFGQKPVHHAGGVVCAEVAAQRQVDDAGLGLLAGQERVLHGVVDAECDVLVAQVAAGSHDLRLRGAAVEGVGLLHVVGDVVVLGHGIGDVALVAAGHDARCVRTVEVVVVVGREVFDGVGVIPVLHRVEHGAGVVVVVVVAFGILLACGDLADVAEAGRAVGLEEVDVVRVDAAVDDARHDSLAGIGLRQVDALVDLVDADFLADDIHLLVHTARQLHAVDAFQGCDALDIGQGDDGDGDVAAHAQHLHALCLELCTAVAVLEFDHCHRVLRDTLPPLERAGAAVVGGDGRVAEPVQGHLALQVELRLSEGYGCESGTECCE